MPVGRYLLVNLLATAPKVLLFEGIGYFLGFGVAHSMKLIDWFSFVLFGIAAVLIYAYYRIRKYFTNEISKETSL